MPARSGCVLALLLAVSGLAGCVAPDEPQQIDLAAFEAALAAPGEEHEPETVDGEPGLRVKLLEPRDPSRAQKGEQPFVILLYEASGPTPVTDASIQLESWMLEHDHGTGRERDPRHDSGGVFRGQTNHIMGGEWEVRLTLERPNGERFSLAIPFFVQEA